jgi:hypothetical protein
MALVTESLMWCLAAPLIMKDAAGEFDDNPATSLPLRIDPP